MLKNLVERLNKDENAELSREIFVECSQVGTMHSGIEKFSFISNADLEVDTDGLKEKLASVELSNTDTIEANVSKLIAAAKAPTPLTEAVVSTSKTITMTKEDYESLLDMIKDLGKDSISEEDKKLYTKKIKSFLKICVKELGKCNDDNPADAFVTAIVNKLCKLYDCKLEIDKDGLTRKAILISKVNLIVKSMK